MTSPLVPRDEILPGVLGVEGNSIPYAVPITVSMEPKISYPKPSEVLPLIEDTEGDTIPYAVPITVSMHPKTSNPEPLEVRPVIEAEGGTILYPVPIVVSMDPKISPPKPLEVLPLRMIPFGETEPVRFSQQELNRLGKQNLVRPREQQVEIPKELKDHELYVEGDWTAFTVKRSNGIKDKFYRHREYCARFRSLPDVNHFLRECKGKTDIFDGRKLRRVKTVGQDGHGSGTTVGRKASNSSGTNVLTYPNGPIRTQMPPGFL